MVITTSVEIPDPKTLGEAALLASTFLDAAGKQSLRNTPEDKLGKFHFGLGLKIRNSMCINNSALRAEIGGPPGYQPDHMSGEIIKALRLKLLEDGAGETFVASLSSAEEMGRALIIRLTEMTNSGIISWQGGIDGLSYEAYIMRICADDKMVARVGFLKMGKNLGINVAASPYCEWLYPHAPRGARADWNDNFGEDPEFEQQQRELVNLYDAIRSHLISGEITHFVHSGTPMTEFPGVKGMLEMALKCLGD
jgi:hypothetical protein